LQELQLLLLYQVTQALHQQAKKLAQVVEILAQLEVTAVLQHVAQRTAEHVDAENKLS
jgi:hypothetical protein